MAVRAIKNQYRGINAHLHSVWQGLGGWSGFHTNHIPDLMRVMRPQLRQLGYDADVAPSLQIRRLDDPDDLSYPEADVLIFDTHQPFPKPATHPSPLASSSSVQQAGVGELTMTLEAAFANRRSALEYAAIGIYEYLPNKLDQGEPVAWIELLSPSNKPGGSDVKDYVEKREQLLDSGIVFVEIDYLHESAPTLRGIPMYQSRRRSLPTVAPSWAYRIIVIDPRPERTQGIVRVTGFGVDVQIPQVTIPLNGEEVLRFDFDVPYQKTLHETQYSYDADYTQLPLNFQRYALTDQTRIARRMVAVVEAARNSVDLEAEVLPVEDLTLEAALERLDALQRTS